MNNFDPRRFTLVLKRDLLENRKRYLLGSVAIFLANFLATSFCFYAVSRYGETSSSNTYGNPALARGMAVSLVHFLYWGGLLFSLSRTFSNLKTKQGRIASLMLPATNLEKYLSRVLIHTLFYTLAFILAAILADLARMGVYSLFPHNYGSILPGLWKEATGDFPLPSHYSPDRYCFLVAASAWYYSCYLLGSAGFRKRPFLYTMLCQLLLFLFLGTSMDIARNQISLRMDVLDLNRDLWIWLQCGIFALATLFNVWLSYRLFQRIQVIPRKILGR